MSVAPEHLTRLIEDAAGRIDPDQRELFADFSRLILHGVDSHHAGGESMLSTLALEAFEWARLRQPGELRVRVRNPGDRPGHTVVEVLQDDHPFIVDSLRLALRKVAQQERLVIHPILCAERDAEGRLLRVKSPGDGERRESYVYVEFVPRLDEGGRCDELEHSVSQVMGWARDVTTDHRRMIRAVRELVANLEYSGPFLAGGIPRAEKIQRFLDWIVDGRFVFMGMRRYSLRYVDGVPEVQALPKTGLGMWREDGSSRLTEARRGDDIPDEMRDDIEDDRIILITKSRMESRIHRHGRLDRVVVKEHDDQGRLTGLTIMAGLFTLRVLQTPGSQIPLLSERLQAILEEIGVTYGSHDHKSIVTAFDSAPVEVLIGTEVEMLSGLLQELVGALGSTAVHLVVRTHPRGRSLYAAVVLPRAHYREDLRGQLRSLLEQITGASYIDDRTSFADEGTAIIHLFCTAAEGEHLEPNIEELAEQVRVVCSPWEDQVLDALRQRFGGKRAPELAARYETAFPEALRLTTHPLDAVRDIEALEALAEHGTPRFSLYFDQADSERATATLRMYLPEPLLLSDVMQVADNFGIRVVDAMLTPVSPAGRPEAAVESLRILPLGADQDDLDAIAPRLSDALAATLSGSATSDALGGLVLGAGLDWREIDCLRAYLDYFTQVQGALSRPYLRNVLLQNPLAVRLLVRYFQARQDPSLDEAERAEREARLRENFESYRDRIPSLNEDRALVGFFNLIEATLRTNFFAPPREPHRIVFKLDSSKVTELSGVIPYREIFVHSAEMTGIHLRGGSVARGGLRWSDRHDDMREEVLGLMSTQMLKNGLIVPVGAKGGFLLRRADLSPSEARKRADEEYRVFISSLLDVTDNLSADGAVIPPEGVLRPDGDDPYLVVAADKGTAHLSDTANEIALERDFWLGDAFASGGSEGYDHKKYAITARGAWECVLHHFAELGIDAERDSYSVAGIGDMSGDVFGNALLLARRARLLAAFDHRHVFLDPDPDPDASWQERKRLFELPRSSWADYSDELLSAGGGVYPRESKSIPVPIGLRERLGIQAEQVSGQELVRAILAMKVDLLWNGGIGTYVKATHETNADAGDRANDAVRIDANELQARVVGEGGNLGLTQAARVEAALRGTRLDTDAIDNSAGVDLSDHEVNYKIALAPLVRAGQLTAEQRRGLLFAVADHACESVLSHNRSQALSLSLDELRSARDPDIFVRAAQALCEYVQVTPASLQLPDSATLSDRAGKSSGFTRPELAVLLGLAKLHAQAELLESDLPLCDYLDPSYRSYFPERFQQELPEALAGHRLRREISALQVTNRLLDASGAALLFTLTMELGVGVSEAAGAMIQAEDITRMPDLRARLLASAGDSREGVYRALVEVDEGVRQVARYLLRSGRHEPDIGRVKQGNAGLEALRSAIGEYLSEGETRLFTERCERLTGEGIPSELALEIASLPLADRGLNILYLSADTPAGPIEAAKVYAYLGEHTGINWVYGRLSMTDVGSAWDRMVLVDLRGELLDLQREITECVLGRAADDHAQAADAFLSENAGLLDRVRGLQRQAATSSSPTALAVIAERLRGLVQGS
ncbi:MAG: NAD-glutamate dehydrogenase [Deltaproteobacteria bacterium]|nr:NAD-glutamate dehydrogenase [Deltaproteobacteria bacterium]